MEDEKSVADIFDWEEYLCYSKAEAAPQFCFKQVTFVSFCPLES